MRFITQQAILREAFHLLEPSRSAGALAAFFGIVRNHHEGRPVKRLYYECYFPMANKEIHSIRESAIERWGLTEAHLLHRVGLLDVGEIALGVGVASTHRAQAFAACEAIVDEIKRRVPIWKKEFYEDGSSEWVFCKQDARGVFA